MSVSTRIARLQAVSPRYSAVSLGNGLTATWPDITSRPANLAALAGSEAIKNGDITVDANGRITGIGTGALTSVSNAVMGMSLTGQLTYTTPGGPVNLGSVTLSGLGAGSFATLNQLNSGNIATFVAANAIGSTYIGSVAADKITAGTLVAGVVYAGSINASQITAGTMVAERISGGTLTGTSIAIASSAGGWLLNAGYNGTTVEYRRLSGYNVSATNFADPGNAVLQGVTVATSSASGVRGVGNSGGHGLDGSNSTYSSQGLVGSSLGGGYDFYANGAAANYGPFTGSHDCLLALDSATQIGDIVSDVAVVARRGYSQVITQVERSASEADRAVVGVLVNISGVLGESGVPAVFNGETLTVDDFGNAVAALDDEWAGAAGSYRYGVMNSVGEGQINVCGLGGNLQPGDLIITSSIPGKGMRQPDDIIRSSTVAKCREPVSFSAPNEVKMVACIYLCG